MDTKKEEVFELMADGFSMIEDHTSSVDARLGVIERTLGKMRETLSEVQEDVIAMSLAVDKDAETLIATNRIVTRIEKALKVA